MPSMQPSSDLADLDPVRRMALEALSFGIMAGYRTWRGPRLSVGNGVVANHRLVLKGPGRIEIADGANLFAFGVGRRTRIVARTSHALIRIGENARLNCAELHADTLIDVGADCIIAQAVLMDTDMHSLALDRRTNPAAPVRTEPIVLERNVWVGRGAAVLAGVRIGEGSVVALGSVVTMDVPPRVLVAGNPARVVRSLD
jgi:acetyltransferase-like isoleucine patch superfamily enzyme